MLRNDILLYSVFNNTKINKQSYQRSVFAKYLSKVLILLLLFFSKKTQKIAQTFFIFATKIRNIWQLLWWKSLSDQIVCCLYDFITHRIYSGLSLSNHSLMWMRTPQYYEYIPTIPAKLHKLNKRWTMYLYSEH